MRCTLPVMTVVVEGYTLQIALLGCQSVPNSVTSPSVHHHPSRVTLPKISSRGSQSVVDGSAKLVGLILRIQGRSHGTKVHACGTFLVPRAIPAQPQPVHYADPSQQSSHITATAVLDSPSSSRWSRLILVDPDQLEGGQILQTQLYGSLGDNSFQSVAGRIQSCAWRSIFVIYRPQNDTFRRYRVITPSGGPLLFSFILSQWSLAELRAMGFTPNYSMEPQPGQSMRFTRPALQGKGHHTIQF